MDVDASNCEYFFRVDGRRAEGLQTVCGVREYVVDSLNHEKPIQLDTEWPDSDVPESDCARYRHDVTGHVGSRRSGCCRHDVHTEQSGNAEDKKKTVEAWRHSGRWRKETGTHQVEKGAEGRNFATACESASEGKREFASRQGVTQDHLRRKFRTSTILRRWTRGIGSWPRQKRWMMTEKQKMKSHAVGECDKIQRD